MVERYEEVLNQLATASAGIDILKNELYRSEWTSSALKERLVDITSAMSDQPEALSLKKIQQGVREAIAEACKLPQAEKKKALRDLRVRWHPDKNKMLKEFATEVSKIINDELELMEKHPTEEPPAFKEMPTPVKALPAVAEANADAEAACETA